MTSPEEIAREVVRSTPTPERLADLDVVTQRRVVRAAEAAGISPEQLWAASRAASIAAIGANDEADRIAAEVHS